MSVFKLFYLKHYRNKMKSCQRLKYVVNFISLYSGQMKNIIPVLIKYLRLKVLSTLKKV